jgi:hypothetical protein
MKSQERPQLLHEESQAPPIVFVDIYTNKKMIIFDSLGYFRTLSSNSFSNAKSFLVEIRGFFNFFNFKKKN